MTFTNLKKPLNPPINPPANPYSPSSNNNFSSDDRPLKSTRQGYGDALVKLGGKKDVVVLSADLTASTKTDAFEKKYPERFFQCGVAEQNMVGMAVGLALLGKTPFVSTFAAFIPNRALDQVRVGACYNNLPIKFCSTHAGLTVGGDGATHQALEDIASMRSLPNMKVIVPSDYDEAFKATIASYEEKGPVYIRLGRSKLPRISTQHHPFVIGKANLMRPGTDVTIIACGVMVFQALKAARILMSRGVSAEVINMHTIKPIDVDAIVVSAKKTRRVVTAEEHQVYGGLSSAVAEVLAKNIPTKMEFVAVDDTFGESGKPDELLGKYGVDYNAIVHAVERIMRD